jgi:hypothetical protein
LLRQSGENLAISYEFDFFELSPDQKTIKSQRQKHESKRIFKFSEPSIANKGDTNILRVKSSAPFSFEEV